MLHPFAPSLLLLALGSAPAPQDDPPENPPITVESSAQDPTLSPPLYEDLHRDSLFITVSDGTRLATDVFRPAVDGVPVSEPLPLVFVLTRYNRSLMAGDRVIDLPRQDPMLRELVRRGYVIAATDVRGGGASFGTYLGPFSPRETQDTREILAWFAAQPWCDGNIGMQGTSYLGAVQLFAAATGLPHLKAIIPAMAPSDFYAFAWGGGILREDFLRQWTAITRRLDMNRTVAPVGEGEGAEALLTEAIAEHEANLLTFEQYGALPFRDSVDPAFPGFQPYLWGTIHQLAEIGKSNVAIYHLGGWLDCFTRDTLLLYGNLPNPQRIAMGPWFHGHRHAFDNFGEHLRWYDRWLKGIENGIDEEPPVHYYVVGAPAGRGWRTADTWPVEADRTTFHLVATPGDPAWGVLDPAPAEPATVDYVVDYTTTSGTGNRWHNGYGGPVGYEDMAANDVKGISFTGEPFEQAREIVGHPVVTLWVSSTANDGDFFVYLEEVEPDGFSRYVTEGSLRASHRARAEPPYDKFGLPYHRSYAEDVQPLTPGEPAALVLDLQPTAWHFEAGHCLRVTVTCADADNMRTPVLDPAPTVTLLTGGAHDSNILLPFLN